MKNFVLIGLIIILFVACHTNTLEDKAYPSDYLFMQRSYPHGKIDIEAYRKSLQKRQKENIKTRAFDQPWESLGPTNISGRITDIEMPVSSDSRVYAGSASGGVFLSEDTGQSWRPIFDDQAALSIGDMAISQNNDNLIYVGTGESNAGGGSLAYDGNGIYRSLDAGETWVHIGLEDAGSIGRVAIDPANDDVVYVGAMGALFENDEHGGIYKTTNGGDTWDQILFLSDSTGCIDLVTHPDNSNVVYAAMWERIRRPHNRQYGGETSGIYRSSDGGNTWTELINGLPTAREDKGRIGIAISASSPNILYAVYADAVGSLTAVYLTQDGGDSWEQKSIDGILPNSFWWWFGRIYIHPTNPNDLYVTSLTMSRSIDGANNWEEVFTNAHVDHHAMFIHPEFDIVFNGNDGGVNRGLSPTNSDSDYLPGINNFQFYTCTIDPNNPDLIFGGSQDNGTNRISSQLTNEWNGILGGDGFRVVVDPNNSDIIYAESQRGNIARSDNGGDDFTNISSGLTGAFNWNTPIAIDPNNTEVLYTGSQTLFRTENRGGDWESISPSLVNEDGPRGNITFGSLTSIDVSSHDSNIIFVGTDDGEVWVTQDRGVTYEDISEGIPHRWITAIVHDPLDDQGVYVTVSGFRFGESSAQVFYSNDLGQNWVDIGSTLPDIPVNDVIVDDVIPGLVFVATDLGVYLTLDGGAQWDLLGAELPIVPIIDIDLHSSSRTLVAASYGRGMFRYTLPEEISSTEEIEHNVTNLYYPNPTSGYLTLNATTTPSYLKVYNQHGQVILVSSETSAIDLSQFEKGIYFVTCFFEDGRKAKATQKVLLQ